MTFITRGGDGLEDTNKDRKATRSEGMSLKGSASRALMRQGGEEDVLGEVKGVDVMGVRVSGRRARDRGDRRKEVEVNNKRRSFGHDVSNLVLETIEESCAFGEDRVLVGLR